MQAKSIILPGCLCIVEVLASPMTSSAQQTVSSRTGLDAARALEQSMVQCIASAEKSVVAIARGRRGNARELQDPQFVPYEYTTGVVVDANGLILTNYHSLGDVAANDFVIWIGGKSYSNVIVKAADPWSDLAVLETNARKLTPIELGSALGLKKGRIVIALGNPYAIARDGNVSATWGIVSNVSRKIDGPLQGVSGPDVVHPRDRETRYHFGGLVQTDAKLARGTSGGPLLDLDGKMIGLSTAIAMLAGFEKGTGYAIPVDEHFKRVLEKLKLGEEVEQGFLGVAPRNPDPSKNEQGVVLERVERGTPAGQGGLFAFDEILQIDDQSVTSIDDLFFQVGSLPPDHLVQIKVRRSMRELTVPVRLTKKPNTASRQIVSTASAPQWRGVQVDYGTALSTKRLGALDPDGCVIIKRVEPDSPAWRAGLRVGAMVSHVEDDRVATPSEFHAAVANASGDVRLSTYDRLSRPTVVVGE